MKHLKIMLLVIVLLTATQVQAQAPFKGSCLSGNCKTGEGSYQIAENVVYKGGFKNGMPNGQARIEGPNWYITGTFEGDMLTNYEERYTGAGFANGGLQRTGSQKLVLFDYKHVQANFMTNNFYEMNGTYFQCICSGTCTFYRDADWSVTGVFNTASQNQLMGKAVIKYKGTDYQFNFPGSGEWVSVVKKDRILECLKAQNYSTGVLYDYNNPNAAVVNSSPVKTLTGDDGSSKTSTGTGTIKDMNDQMDSIKAADKIVRARALQTTIQEDFCTTLNRVIKEVPNNFETWKGERKPEFFNMGKIWYAKYMVKGAVYATVHDDMLVSYNSWGCCLFSGHANFSDVLAVYQGYVDKVNACTQSCCTFSSSVKNSRELGYAGQETTWKVTALQPGSSEKYRNTKISLDFSLNTISDEWYIHMWVH